MIYRMGTYAQRLGETTLIPDDNATWTNIVGAITTGLGSIVPSSAAAGWNKGASFGTVPTATDFVFSFEFDHRVGVTNGAAVMGLSSSYTGATQSDVEFGIYLYDIGNTERILIYESGVSKLNLGNGSWNLGDTFEIKKVGTAITYYQNGSLIYTSASTSTTSMVFNSTIYQDLGAKNLKIVY
tara:strand:+ start:315 stop:863 length:549 start_codon:yes stop_codon:yes gene_type:complete